MVKTLHNSEWDNGAVAFVGLSAACMKIESVCIAATLAESGILTVWKDQEKAQKTNENSHEVKDFDCIIFIRITIRIIVVYD